MLYQIYSCFDCKTEAYLQPFYSINENTAVRAIRDCFFNADHMLNKNSEDFSLVYIGTFDDNTGKVDTDRPIHLHTVSEIKREFLKELENKEELEK